MESILLVGIPGVGKSQLVNVLQCIQSPHQSSNNIYKLQIDTKYYTADVLLRTVDTQHHLSSQLEALLLVFDSKDKNSFTSIRKWAERHDTEDIEVKLVIANKVDQLQQGPETSRPQWLEDAISWCHDNGFEYIETAAAQPEIDQQLQLDGDQQGVARVLAALQAHMWPGMVEKQWKPAAASSKQQTDPVEPSTAQPTNEVQNNSKTASDVLVQSSSAADQGVQPAEIQQHQQDGEQSDAPYSAAVADGKAANTAAFVNNSSGSKQQKPQQQQQRQQQQPLVSVSDGAMADQEPFLEDFDLDDFEKLMKQVQGVRSQLSGLSDSDRRSAAADMAMKLAAMMGLGDSEDEESQEGMH